MTLLSLFHEKLRDTVAKDGLVPFLRNDPFPHIYVRDAFDASLYEKVLQIAENTWASHKLDPSYGLRRYLSTLADKDLLWSFYGPEFTMLLSRAFGERIARDKIEYADFRFFGEDFRGIDVHTDYADKNHGSYVGIYYMGNGHWTDEDGGQLILWKEAEQDRLEPAVIIPPDDNSLVIMKVQPDGWHSVRPTTQGRRRSNLYLPYRQAQ
jgi:hypothetical protein